VGRKSWRRILRGDLVGRLEPCQGRRHDVKGSIVAKAPAPLKHTQPPRKRRRDGRAACSPPITLPTKEHSMGLQERRKIHELQTVTLPGRSREIAEICGREIPYEVDWDSLADDAAGLNFLDNLSCHRLNMALREICMDELGREAVRQGLRQVRLRNVSSPEQRHLRFADGVLEMHCAYAQGTAGMHSDAAIRDALLAAL
jgi:hypothetical protein